MLDDDTCRKLISARLDDLGWNKAELARRSGYSPSSISNLLGGNRPLEATARLRIGLALGLELDETVTPFGRPKSAAQIPVDAAVDAEGTLSGETAALMNMPRGLWRRGPIPAWELVEADGAREGSGHRLPASASTNVSRRNVLS